MNKQLAMFQHLSNPQKPECSDLLAFHKIKFGEKIDITWGISLKPPGFSFDVFLIESRSSNSVRWTQNVEL